MKTFKEETIKGVLNKYSELISQYAAQGKDNGFGKELKIQARIKEEAIYECQQLLIKACSGEKNG
jgi:hypothetical protein